MMVLVGDLPDSNKFAFINAGKHHGAPKHGHGYGHKHHGPAKHGHGAYGEDIH